jgi:hypothetical protein
MRPVLQTDRNITSTLEGERIVMSFDENSLAQLQNTYINLYKDREMAVLREYSCNALDSHVQAGNTDPIEVTLPSRFDPILKITDYGTGLSVDDLRDIYSKYGASTKRDSDEVIGMFGVGGKSALTFTDQFTIRARKDGREVIVSVSRNAQGIGELTIAYEGATDEPNGVEITIPCPSYTTFAEKARDLFQYWPEGSVLVDGEEPVRFTKNESVKHLFGDIYFDSSTSYYNEKKSVVVMGNVPYPVELSELGLNFESAHTSGKNVYHRIIAFVPVGSVEPIPAREGLTTTKANEDALLAIGESIKTNASTLIQTEIDKAESKLKAIGVIHEVQRHYPHVFWPKVWTHKGEEIPKKVEATTPIVTTEKDENGYTKRSAGGFVLVGYGDSGKTHRRTKDLSWYEMTTGIYFTGFNLDRFTPSHRRRIDQWVDDHIDDQTVRGARVYILTETLPDNEMIDQTKIYDWEDVRSIKLPSTRTSSGLAGRYDTLRSTNGSLYTATSAADEIDASKPIFFYCALETKRPDRSGYSRTKSRSDHAAAYARVLLKTYPDAQFYCLPPNRRAKFERNFPNALEMTEVIQKESTQWATNLTKRQRRMLSLSQSRHISIYKHLEPIRTRILDHDLREQVQIANADSEALIGQYKGYIPLVLDLNEVLKLEPETNVNERYPLVDGFSSHEHILVYLNSAYETFYKQSTKETVNA